MPSPVRRMAESRGIPVVTPEKIRDSGFSRHAEIMESAGYRCRSLWTHSAQVRFGSVAARMFERALLSFA